MCTYEYTAVLRIHKWQNNKMQLEPRLVQKNIESSGFGLRNKSRHNAITFCFVLFFSQSQFSFKRQPPLLLHAKKVGPSRLNAEMPRWGFKWNAHWLCSGKHVLIDNRTERLIWLIGMCTSALSVCHLFLKTLRSMCLHLRRWNDLTVCCP